MPPAPAAADDPEHQRLLADAARGANWKRWGPYLAERQWATVREDYSADGSCWTYFPHDHARSRAYRWGEDGLFGWTDRECRLCFAVALWNGRDPILKERFFGLTAAQGNHGEDVKELFYYVDSTPTHSYVRQLYKYPQAAFPYQQLIDENGRRTRNDPEFELLDTGIFNGNAYFDVIAEFAKASPDDTMIRLTICNRGSAPAPLHVLPTAWFRNVWSWGCNDEGCGPRTQWQADGGGRIVSRHATLGSFAFEVDASPPFLFTENETDAIRIFGSRNGSPFVKDAFHRVVVNGDATAANPQQIGSKAAAHYKLIVPAGGRVELRCRLRPADDRTPAFGGFFDATFAQRQLEADAFYARVLDPKQPPAANDVARKAFGGLFCSKQFYNYVVSSWLDGDPLEPPPPARRLQGRNHDWRHLYTRDVLLMPDKWEYPWFAAWDWGFHCVTAARADPHLAKQQLIIPMREWYMHPNGQMPAYEFAFGDVNPPVHAWACWRTYKIADPRGRRDREFLERAFHKLLINFTWWVNRKDVEGRHLFAGGFLGLDNIGVFDRSQPLPGGRRLTQADGTAWMAFYALTMLDISLELAGGSHGQAGNPAYEDIASKFFEHFIAITDAMNTLGGTGLWDDRDGFYYDQLLAPDGSTTVLRLRSMVGLVPLFACLTLDREVLDKLPNFRKRMQWFLGNRPDLAKTISFVDGTDGSPRYLLAVPSRERLEKVLAYVFDEGEFLSPHGLRSLSKYHGAHPFRLELEGKTFAADYEPAESRTPLFGGNSNWRGPIWFPLNFLLVDALERYHYYYGGNFTVDLPTGSGNRVTLLDASNEIRRRLTGIFLPDASTGKRPCDGQDDRYAADPNWKDLLTFNEYFDGDTGKGLGASHQTGWTALVASLLK